MAPAVDLEQSTHILPSHQKNGGSYPSPLDLTGALDKFLYEDTTPAIGREFPNVNIVDDLLNASDADELIRDLAITSELNLNQICLWLSGIVEPLETDMVYSFSKRRCVLPSAG